MRLAIASNMINSNKSLIGALITSLAILCACGQALELAPDIQADDSTLACVCSTDDECMEKCVTDEQAAKGWTGGPYDGCVWNEENEDLDCEEN